MPIFKSLEPKIEQEAYEIEHHHHGYEKWFGLAGTPSATHKADRITLKPNPFQCDAGNDTWGSWVQILGSADTPVISTNNYFDLHRLLIAGWEVNNQDYFIQIATGASASLAGLLTAETFTEVGIITAGALSQVGPVAIMKKRVAKGSEVWARIWADGQNTATLDFYFGLHEYER